MKIGPSVPVPASRCPYCGVTHDHAFGAGNESTPSVDDISLCIKCGNFSVFGPDLVLAKPSPELLAEIVKDKNCQRAYLGIVSFNHERARNN